MATGYNNINRTNYYDPKIDTKIWLEYFLCLEKKIKTSWQDFWHE